MNATALCCPLVLGRRFLAIVCLLLLCEGEECNELTPRLGSMC